MMRDTEIIEQIRNRNEAGVEALLKQYGAMLSYIVTPILTVGEDREECVFEVAMQIWEKIDSYDERRGSFRAWMTAIARNAALNRVRGKQHAIPTEELTDEIAHPQPTLEERIIRKEQQTTLAFALARLNKKEQELFYRKYYYLQSTAQIGAELGMTERAVEGKLYRLKKRLRKMLAEF